MADKGSERRAHNRIRFLGLAAYKASVTVGEGLGRTLDFSPKGMKLESPKEIQEGSLIEAEVAVEDDIFKLKGKVVRSVPQGKLFHIGVEFTESVSKKLLSKLKEK